MRNTKTLNISVETHKAVKRAAIETDTPLYEFVEALLAVGLARQKEVRRLLAERTKQEEQQAQESRLRP